MYTYINTASGVKCVRWFSRHLALSRRTADSSATAAYTEPRLLLVPDQKKVLGRERTGTHVSCSPKKGTAKTQRLLHLPRAFFSRSAAHTLSLAPHRAEYAAPAQAKYTGVNAQRHALLELEPHTPTYTTSAATVSGIIAWSEESYERAHRCIVVVHHQPTPF